MLCLDMVSVRKYQTLYLNSALIVHFLFDKIKKDDDDKPPHVFGVTSAANCENGDKIIYEFLNQLEVDKIPNTPLGMRQQFVRNVTKLLEAQSVIIPYIIKYDNIDKDCTHFKTFLEDYWDPINQSINDNLSEKFQNTHLFYC
ncbi:MAG: hypothetical protein IPN94_09185 [Sphingobacteriales bacterium]|nr:hypothetical protein [Sphingobacteriales bacterium]